MEKAVEAGEVSKRPREADVEAGPSLTAERGRTEPEDEPVAARGLRALEEERPHREAEEQERRERERWLEPDDDVSLSQERALQLEHERQHQEHVMERELDMGGMEM
jgi:ATP-dependent helicase YprA (DUF1998 family)